MEKNTRTKNILLVVLLVAVLTLSISYALLTQQLTITSQAVVGGQSGWNVKFTAANCTAGGYTSNITQFNSGNVSALNPVASLTGLTGTFHAPGDAIICNITVSNLGSIDATIDTFTLGDQNLTVRGSAQDAAAKAADEALISNKLVYTLKYATGDQYAGQVPGNTNETNTDIDPDLIPHGSTNNTRNFILTITYPASETQLPSDDVTVSGFNTIMVYKQA